MAFLTRIPVGISLGPDDVARGAPLFPLVGAAVGAGAGLVAVAAAEVAPPLAAAGIALAAAALLTGALHLDALADTADGLGGRTREHVLEIMRDHRLGAYGTVALVLDLLVKAAALAALLPGRDAVLALVAAGAVSRAAPLPLAAALPYARDAGLGASVARTTWLRAGVGAALALAVATAALGADGLVVAAVAAVAAAVPAVWSRRRLGGVTGDVLGAATELAETAALVAAASLL